MRRIRPALLLLAALHFVVGTAAQHVHIQTSFTSAAGWEIFWYDFDAGAFRAGDFVQPVPGAARRRIANDPVLTNAIGAVGNPVWILPQAETPDVPSLGFGTQGLGSFESGQIRLRLATFSGPGHLAIYSVGAFGGANLILTTRDGLGSSDALTLQFPRGHVHVAWAFTRPGLYTFGWRAEGTLSGGQNTNSAVVEFSFRVAEPARPHLRLSASSGTQRILTVQSEPHLPLTIEASSDLIQWDTATNLWLETVTRNWTNHSVEPAQFYRAFHSFP
jgi:surface-anchored protein